MRFYLTLYFTKLIHLLSKLFKRGSGFVWPGHFALWLYPNILNDKRLHFSKGVILISGTNGKTTTAKLITHFLRSYKYSVVTNSTGANLLNGIVSTILLNTSIFGKFSYDYGVFEVDEFSLPYILDFIEPSVLLLLNLSRDQLDRHGETDIIFAKWKKAILLLNKSNLVLYKDQKQFKSLSKNLSSNFTGKVLFFDDSSTYLQVSNLKGSFNAKNLNASFLTLQLLIKDNLLEEKYIKCLKDFKSAYGRGESILFKDKIYHLYLAKNPASFNSNLHLLSSFDPKTTALLFILNDNIPDGRDVSWIYDINSKELFEGVSPFDSNNIYVSGTRFLDMAIRLNYANIFFNTKNIDSNLKKIILEISQNQNISDVLVLPNYSAMLAFRKITVGRAIL